MASSHQVLTKAIPIMITPKLHCQSRSDQGEVGRNRSGIPKDDKAEPVTRAHFAQKDVGWQFLDVSICQLLLPGSGYRAACKS